MKYIKSTFILVLFLIILSPFITAKAIGQTSSSVNASVKISVCGNGIIENGEDCEGTNLNNKTCQSLGYSGGTLSCDISCSYDTSACIPATPIPTPTLYPTSMPTPTPTPGATQASTQASVISSTPTPTPFPTPTPIEFQSSTPQPTINSSQKKKSILPPALKIFDFNGDGKIDSNLHGVVSLWVNSWRQYLEQSILSKNQSQKPVCDINQNGSCNLDDFSILMYYIRR